MIFCSYDVDGLCNEREASGWRWRLAITSSKNPTLFECTLFVRTSKCICLNCKNIYVQIAKCICLNFKTYLSKLGEGGGQNCDWRLRAAITPLFCPSALYLSKLQNIFFQIAKCICLNLEMYLSKLGEGGGRGGDWRLRAAITPLFCPSAVRLERKCTRTEGTCPFWPIREFSPFLLLFYCHRMGPTEKRLAHSVP